MKDDPLCPTVKVSKAELKYPCQPWRKAILVKLLGKRLGMKFLRQRLIKLWQPEGGMDMIDLENDYFLIRFSNMADVSRVFEGGPWMILDHYLMIRKWHPEFFPSQDEFKRVAVWVRIPGLPIEYYDKHILWRIGSSLGFMLKIDNNTLRQKGASTDDEFITERGKFARICVEVVSIFKLNGVHGDKVVQEQPQPGGTQVAQPETEKADPNQQPAENPETFGNWMIAPRKSRKPPAKSNGSGDNSVQINHGKQKVNIQHGSRFGILGDINHEEEMRHNQENLVEPSSVVRDNVQKYGLHSHVGKEKNHSPIGPSSPVNTSKRVDIPLTKAQEGDPGSTSIIRDLRGTKGLASIKRTEPDASIVVPRAPANSQHATAAPTSTCLGHVEPLHGSGIDPGVEHNGRPPDPNMQHAACMDGTSLLQNDADAEMAIDGTNASPQC
ncbi:hypothetical protein SESBI_23885 [Sesbania bispinosa]|nr:hypothetical protein SESBI_23885 [Sesbania bispinosa]